MLKHIKEYREFEFHPELEINEGFSDGVKNLWDSFKKLLSRIFQKEAQKTLQPTQVKKQQVAKQPSPIEGQHMLYLPHQQGPSGAVKLVNVYLGKEKLNSSDRNNMLKNMPSSDPGYAKVLKGNDKEAVLAFLNYQKNTWDKYKKEALNKINLPQHKVVKNAIEKLPNPNFPKEFLTTVAYKESRFDPDPDTNRTYKGLFQIGPSAWEQLKKISPDKYRGEIPIDPFKNTQAGNDYLKWTYEQFEKNMVV